MVFDVESVGLHGQGFAVGYVVVNGFGVEITHALIACSPMAANGDDDDRNWVAENVPVFEPTIKCKEPFEVRQAFWNQWLCWKDRGTVLVADCCWPVEARFLIECVDNDRAHRMWQGPYPLHDIASVLLAHGKNPTEKFTRLPSELPEHNPLNDARQSARILIESLNENRDSDYFELICAVESVHPNESRHQTALRYIKDREAIPSESGCKKESK